MRGGGEKVSQLRCDEHLLFHNHSSLKLNKEPWKIYAQNLEKQRGCYELDFADLSLCRNFSVDMLAGSNSKTPSPKIFI